MFTLDAVVTREGRLVNLDASARRGQQRERKLIEALLGCGVAGAVRAGRDRASPAAANSTMVWLVAHTTVRATKSIDVTCAAARREETPGRARAIPAHRRRPSLGHLTS